jgi:hypothetical protein
MALLAEELVEEWLNRLGYFTIRGIKLGVHEMDLLAVRPAVNGLECRHVEVQASVRPVSYMTRVPKSVQKETGLAAEKKKKRSPEELKLGVKEWVHNKFLKELKSRVREKLAPGPWSFELVVHKLKHQEELELIRQEGIKVHLLSDIVEHLRSETGQIQAAASADFVDLVLLEDSLSIRKY